MHKTLRAPTLLTAAAGWTLAGDSATYIDAGDDDQVGLIFGISKALGCTGVSFWVEQMSQVQPYYPDEERATLTILDVSTCILSRAEIAINEDTIDAGRGVLGHLFNIAKEMRYSRVWVKANGGDAIVGVYSWSRTQK